MTSTLFVSLLLSCPCIVKPSGFAGGTGALDDPYLVCSPAQLDLVREDLDAHYRLAADIDLAGVTWTPIADGTFSNDDLLFNGTFDGAGFTVRNLVAGGPSAEVIGLFGRIGLSGVVRDLRVENADVAASLCCGALTAENRGLIERCSVSGSVSGGTYIGGFIGDNQAVIVDSYSEASVNASGFVGGFAGVTFVNQSGTPQMHRCHAVGAVSGGSNTGGFVGGYLGPASSIDCFWNVETTGQVTGPGGTGVTSEQMMSQATFDPPWDFDHVWTMSGGNFPRHQLVGDTSGCCPEDIDGDGTVGVTDLLAVITDWGSSDAASDVDDDGVVGIEDLLAVILAWGTCP